jgi:hypothetical protein
MAQKGPKMVEIRDRTDEELVSSLEPRVTSCSA